MPTASPAGSAARAPAAYDDPGGVTGSGVTSVTVKRR